MTLQSEEYKLVLEFAQTELRLDTDPVLRAAWAVVENDRIQVLDHPSCRHPTCVFVRALHASTEAQRVKLEMESEAGK